MRTREDILAEIGDKLQGQIEVTGRAEAEKVLRVLEEIGYKGQLIYFATGQDQAVITYLYHKSPSNNTGQTTWRDVDRECQRSLGGLDFETAARRMGLDPAEMRRQKHRDLGY